MTSAEFQQLEREMKLLGKKLKSREGYMSESRMLAVRDQVFRSIGRWEMVEAVIPADAKPTKGFLGFLLGKPHKLSLSMPATVMALIITVLGSVTTSVIAQNAVPGDTFYGWHKAFEGLNLWLVSGNPEKQAELRLKYADNRLRNLEYVSPSDPRNLAEILSESKEAIAKATVAVNNLEDKDSSKEYATKLETLLAAQKSLITELEAEELDEGTKETLLAIKAELEAKPVAKEEGEVKETAPKDASAKPTTAKEQSPEVATVVPEPTQGDIEKGALTPVVRGYSSILRADLTGTVIAVNDMVALLVGDTYYPISYAPTNIHAFIGRTVTAKGIVQEGHIYISELLVDNTLFAAPAVE